MAKILPSVPSQTCLSSSDGKNFAVRAIIAMRFLHLMAKIWPTVPSQTCISLSDGKNFAHRAIIALHFFV
jgi:hypothetical protein